MRTLLLSSCAVLVLSGCTTFGGGVPVPRGTSIAPLVQPMWEQGIASECRSVGVERWLSNSRMCAGSAGDTTVVILLNSRNEPYFRQRGWNVPRAEAPATISHVWSQLVERFGAGGSCAMPHIGRWFVRGAGNYLVVLEVTGLEEQSRERVGVAIVEYFQSLRQDDREMQALRACGLR